MTRKIDKRACRKFALPELEFNLNEGVLHVESCPYIIRTAVRNIAGQRILMLYIYQREHILTGSINPRWVMFQSRDDFATLSLRENASATWQCSMLDSLDRIYRFDTKCAFYRQQDEARATRFCKCDHIPGKTISFSKGMIMNMLSNERYCGDVILQKSVTVDCIEKKRKKNTGEAPMYYVQNDHPAIIDRVTFNKVQEELARRKTKTPGSAKSSITSTGKYSRYALTDVLICGNCGTRYRRVTWSRNGVKRIVWRCISRLDYGKKYCSDSPTIMEDKLQEAIVRAVNKFNEQDNATYKALMRATISEALGLNGDPEEVDMLERKIEALNNKMLALVNESVSSGDGIEAHESEFMTLSQEAEFLKQRIAAIQESTAKDNGEQNRLEQIQAIIAERESKCMEYDDSIVRQMVECIKVYPGGKLEIIFGGGYLVEESV